MDTWHQAVELYSPRNIGTLLTTYDKLERKTLQWADQGLTSVQTQLAAHIEARAKVTPNGEFDAQAFGYKALSGIAGGVQQVAVPVMKGWLNAKSAVLLTSGAEKLGMAREATATAGLLASVAVVAAQPEAGAPLRTALADGAKTLVHRKFDDARQQFEDTPVEAGFSLGTKAAIGIAGFVALGGAALGVRKILLDKAAAVSESAGRAQLIKYTAQSIERNGAKLNALKAFLKELPADFSSGGRPLTNELKLSHELVSAQENLLQKQKTLLEAACKVPEGSRNTPAVTQLRQEIGQLAPKVQNLTADLWNTLSKKSEEAVDHWFNYGRNMAVDVRSYGMKTLTDRHNELYKAMTTLEAWLKHL